jgi:uncharacterized tellurite resistance protein B-like protein
MRRPLSCMGSNKRTWGSVRPVGFALLSGTHRKNHTMDIDTKTIRRLRDNIIDSKDLSADRLGRRTTPAMKTSILSRLRPFAETMYLVMVADGRTDSAELDALIAALQILSGGQVEEVELNDLVEQFSQATNYDHVESRIAYLGALLSSDRDDRETAFTLAAVIALADDSVALAENSVLEMVSEYFGISNNRAGELLNHVG